MSKINQTLNQPWRLSEQRYHPYVVSLDNQFVYVPILKNAHKFATHVFANQCRWNKIFPKNNHPFSKIDFSINHYKKLIVLRDPIDRWISSMSAYLFLHHTKWDYQNNDLFELLFDVIIIDEHTKPQVNFLENIDIEDCVFFNFNTNLTDNFQSWINDNIDPDIQIGVNTPKNNTEHKPLQNYIKTKLSSMVLNYKDRLFSTYKEDYNLINSIQFYKRSV